VSRVGWRSLPANSQRRQRAIFEYLETFYNTERRLHTPHSVTEARQTSKTIEYVWLARYKVNVFV
jgi:hypothetical protein